MRSYNRYSSTEEFGKRQGGNGISSWRGEIKVRKNEMKLRKNDFEVRKNSFVPRWRISVFCRGIFDFFGGGGRRLEVRGEIGAIRAVGAIWRVTFVGELELRLYCGLVVRFAGLGV